MRRVPLLIVLLLVPAVLSGQRSGRTSTSAVDAAQARARAGAAKLYDTAVLHRIDIVIAPEEVGKIPRRTTERVRCTFTIDGITLKNVGVRQAGGIYHPYVPITNKPSLSLKFDEFVRNQLLFDLDKLVLKNGLQDHGLINEHLAYEVFRRAGLAASLTAHARVTINGIDSGIYLMREPVDKEFLVRNFGKAFADGNLYEIENKHDFVDGPGGVALDDEGKNGRTRTDLVRFADAIRATSATRFVADLSKYLDIDRFITFVAAERATAHWDGLTYRNNNTYLYAHPKEGKFLLIPYGTDQAFRGSSGFRGWAYERPQSALVRRMLSVPDLVNRYHAEVARVGREPVWNQNVLLDRIDLVARILQGAERSGRTGADVARFFSTRPAIERLIRGGGMAP
jgi:spore coat protein CotH